MTQDSHIDPSRAAFDAFKALPRDHPIDMLNLVAFHTVARDPGAATPRSGAEAYRAYAAASAPIFARVGGTILWRGAMQAMLIGPVDEAWDEVFIARYPSAAAFLAMVTDPVYQRAVTHRQAAVRTSRLIRLAPRSAGVSFG